MLLLLLAAVTSTSASTPALASTSTSAPVLPLTAAERRFAERHVGLCPLERNATYGRWMKYVELGSPRILGTCLGLAQRALTPEERAALIAGSGAAALTAGSGATALDAEVAPSAASLTAVGMFGTGAIAVFSGGLTALLGGLRGDEKGESLAIGGGLIALSGAVVAAAGFIWTLQTEDDHVVPHPRVDAYNRDVAVELGLDPARGEAWARSSTTTRWPSLDRVRADVAPQLLHPVSAFGTTPIEWVSSERGSYFVGGQPVHISGVQRGEEPHFLTDAELRILLGPDALPARSASPSAWVGGSLMLVSVLGGLSGMVASAAIDDVPAHTTFAFDALLTGGAVVGAMIGNYAAGPDAALATQLRAIHAHNDAVVDAALRRAPAP